MSKKSLFKKNGLDEAGKPVVNDGAKNPDPKKDDPKGDAPETVVVDDDVVDTKPDEGGKDDDTKDDGAAELEKKLKKLLERMDVLEKENKNLKKALEAKPSQTPAVAVIEANEYLAVKARIRGDNDEAVGYEVLYCVQNEDGTYEFSYNDDEELAKKELAYVKGSADAMEVRAFAVDAYGNVTSNVPLSDRDAAVLHRVRQSRARRRQQ